MNKLRCKSWDELEVHLEVIQERLRELERKQRFMEKQLDTHGSSWWKRVWFRIDGWPGWWVVAEKRAWRPWHRSK